MPELREKKVAVRLTDEWWFALKYDENGGWYRKVIEPVLKGQIKKYKPGDDKPKDESTRAVDGVCARDGLVLLIEIKDMRGFMDQPENQDRIRPDEPMFATECVLKVRDTIAGIIGAVHVAADPTDWSRLAQILATRSAAGRSSVAVIALAIGDNLEPEALGAVGMALSKKFSWLTRDVAVMDPRDESSKALLEREGIQVIIDD